MKIHPVWIKIILMSLVIIQSVAQVNPNPTTHQPSSMPSKVPSEERLENIIRITDCVLLESEILRIFFAYKLPSNGFDDNTDAFEINQVTEWIEYRNLLIDPQEILEANATGFINDTKQGSQNSIDLNSIYYKSDCNEDSVKPSDNQNCDGGANELLLNWVYIDFPLLDCITEDEKGFAGHYKLGEDNKTDFYSAGCPNIYPREYKINKNLCPPTPAPTDVPSDEPSSMPSDEPSDVPSDVPSESPSDGPSDSPSLKPSDVPSDVPSDAPSDAPSDSPSLMPSDVPSDVPSDAPSDEPSKMPSSAPTPSPTPSPPP